MRAPQRAARAPDFLRAATATAFLVAGAFLAATATVFWPGLIRSSAGRLSRTPAATLGLVVGRDELHQLRVDQFAPAAAAEDAVVARALDFVVLALRIGNAGAQAVRGFGLARARDVVEFAFDGQQRGRVDVLRTHAFDLAFGVLDVPGAVHELELLEHGADRVEVVIGVHVEHGVVLVIELAVRLGAGVIALDQVLEVVVMAAGMAVGVHRHAAGVLQEAGVHATAFAREALRHAVDHVVLEPLVALVHREVVDRGGRLAGVDRATHHRQRERQRLLAARHERHGRQHGHGRLAYAHHVAVAVFGLQASDELLHVVDVVVEVELAFGHGHEACVLPVGDVDLVVLQHGAHGVAQQRGVVARERRNDQHHGLALERLEDVRLVGEALEAAQFAEGLVELDRFLDHDVFAVDLHGLDVELGLLVVLAQPIEQVVARGHALGHGQLAPDGALAVELGDRLREVRERLHQGTLGFVELVEHRWSWSGMLQCNISAHSLRRRGPNPYIDPAARGLLCKSVKESSSDGFPHTLLSPR